MRHVDRAVRSEKSRRTTERLTRHRRRQDGQPPGNDFQKIERNLEFSWLEAEGERVIVRSKLYGVVARMTRLTYNADTQMLSMGSDQSENDVTVVRNRSELSAPEIEAHLSFGEPNPLRSLFCFGKGELTYADEETGRPAFVAKWQKKLSKKLDEETNLDLIELDEHAVFGQPDRKTGLAADLIRIWLVPLAFGLPSSKGDVDEDEKIPEPEPKRLLAQGDVAFISPQMKIEKTKELDIRFDEEVEKPLASVSQKSRSQLQPAGLSSAPRDRQSRNRPTAIRAVAVEREFLKTREPKARPVGFANIPAIPDGALGPPVDIPTATSPEPFLVFANRIGVRLRRVLGTPRAGSQRSPFRGKSDDYPGTQTRRKADEA